MNTFVTEVRQTILPDRGGEYGLLPPLLVALTFVTGLVDAFSYLVLGHVFVANMTGNVVFLGFALAGAPGFSLTASLTALGSFCLGALAGGRAGRKYGKQRGRLLRTTSGIQAGFLAASVILAAVSGSPVAAGYRYGLVVVLGVAMGMQNAAARQIGVSDLTTSVLTMTLTGLAADGAIAGGKGSKSGRRLLAVVAMFAGALVGAACVLHIRIVYGLVIALVVLVIVGVTTRVLERSDRAWAGG